MGASEMNTAFVLMAQYNGQAIISLERVCCDYFTHLTPEMFQRKVLAGQIKLPITRLEPSQKSARGSILRTWLSIWINSEMLHGKSTRS